MYSDDSMRETKKKKETKTGTSRKFFVALSLVSQLGLRIAACIIIGVFSGKYLDTLCNSKPWFLLLFSGLGVIAAFQVIFSLAKELG